MSRVDQEKVEWLADYWKQVAEGGVPQVCSSSNINKWSSIISGPHLKSKRSSFRIKPVLTPLKFSRLITSKIDCEFSDDLCLDKSSSVIGPLKTIYTADNAYKYKSKQHSWKYCRPREDHWHSWNPGSNTRVPVPDGMLLKIITRDGLTTSTTASDCLWTTLSSDHDAEIIAFRIMGLDDSGYCWPWEAKDNCNC